MPVLTDIGELATPVPGERQGVLRIIGDAAIAWDDGRITWVGEQAQLPGEHAAGASHSAGGQLVIPGLVDCHTHLAFAGWRAGEFESRILGRGYVEIAKAGGGIQRTVNLTREAAEDDLLARCQAHLRDMASLGVTTVECKSGYGLDTEQELKLLRVYARLSETPGRRIVPTFLGAHTVPAEYRGRRGDYVRLVREVMLPEVARAGLARFCDVFVEESAFSREEAREIFRAASALGLRPKLHADQLSDGGGAQLAADVGAISADHLEHVSRSGIHALRESGVVAVSLPIATLYLNQQPMPARALLNAGVPVAVATDFNPGTAPSYHLPLAMLLACTMQRMTPSEVLAGATAVAAAAIGVEREVGVLQPGHAADFAVIEAPDVDHWLYHFRPNACVQTWAGGVRTWDRDAPQPSRDAKP